MTQVLLLFSIILCWYLRIDGSELLLPLATLITALIVVVRRTAASRLAMKGTDWGVLILIAFELASLPFSPYSANGFANAGTVAVSVLLYFFIRLTIHSERQILLLSALIAIFGLCLSCSALLQFDRHVEAFGSVGLTSIVALRARLLSPPAPYVVGEWLTIVLLTLPFAMAVPAYLWCARRYAWAAVSLTAPLAIASVIGVSCSRAVFWSVVAFFAAFSALALLYRLIPPRTALVVLAFALASISGVLVAENAVYPGILKAYVGGQTSQSRSMEGRVAIWKRSLSALKAHPVIGVGAANAPLFLSSDAAEGDTTGFASRTFSLPFQILTEKGLIGSLCYGGVLVLVAWQFHLRMRAHGLTVPRKVVYASLASGLIAVMCRELTYSSLLEHTATAALVFTAMGILSTVPPAREAA